MNGSRLLCDKIGLNVWGVIDAASTKPFGMMRFEPGPGVGEPLHPDRSVLSCLEGETV